MLPMNCINSNMNSHSKSWFAKSTQLPWYSSYTTNIFSTQWKDTDAKKISIIAFNHISSNLFYMHVMGHLKAVICHPSEKWERIEKLREQQFELTQITDQMGFGQRYQDTIPIFPVLWLPNTHHYSGMNHFLYLSQTTVVSNPALASFEPESQLKQCPFNYNQSQKTYSKAFKIMNMRY